MRDSFSDTMREIAINSLIEEAQMAEISRDMVTLTRLLESIWDDFDEDPDFERFTKIQQGRLCRIAAFFLTYSGKCRNIKNYQDRSMEMLGEAITIFNELHDYDAISEATIMTAYCYWHAGSIDECDIVLKSVEDQYCEMPNHPIYLQCMVKKLMVMFWKGEYKEAIETVERLTPLIDESDDHRLKVQFHNQAHLFYTNTKNYPAALEHYERTISSASALGSEHYIGLAHNNAAFLFKDQREFKKAHQVLNEAIEIFARLGDTGWLAHTLDSQALLFLDENYYELALLSVDKAIDYLKTGEDYGVLCDTLWTKILCLYKLERYGEMLHLFGELSQLSSQYIGAVAEKKYTERMLELIYIKKGLPLNEEVRQFKKVEIKNALKFSNITQAAAKLGLNSHQTLSDMLDKQFPEIYEETGIKRRSRGKKETEQKSKQNSALPDSDITYLDASGFKKTFSPYIKIERSEKLVYFYAGENALDSLNLKDISLIAVKAEKNFANGELVVARFEEQFYAGIIKFDSELQMCYLENKYQIPIPLDDNIIIGKLLGYCPISEISDNSVYIRPMLSEKLEK